MSDDSPLVSIGIPVRNGGPRLKEALRTVTGQSYTNLEIIISDNCSTDETPVVCRAVAEQDQRVRYVRQGKFLTAFQNFEFVLRASTGQYFMWAADDDLRSEDFIAALLPRLCDDADAVLAFGDLFVGTPDDGWRHSGGFDFESRELNVLRRLKKCANRQCFHIYGLWRAHMLKRCRFYRTYFWPDLPVMMAASALGTFVRCPGPRLFYYEVHKSRQERMEAEFGRTNKHFLILRVTLATLAAIVAIRRPLLAVPAAWYVFWARFRAWMDIEVRGYCYRLAPRFLRSIWRNVKQAWR